ncbi:energy transducer TonB [Colwelliaceae bacterium 6471]
MLNIRKSSLASAVIIFTSGCSFYALSQEVLTEKQAFEQAYNVYQQANDQGNYYEKRVSAQKSYQLGCKLYGMESDNCAALSVNYANTLWQDDEQVISLFEHALAINVKKYGGDAVEIADLYIQLAEKLSRKTYQDYLDKALDIAKHFEDGSPLLAVDIQFQVAKVYLRHGSRKSRLIIDVYRGLSEALPENETRVVSARMWLAKYYRAKQLYSKSIALNEKNIDIFEQLEGATHPFELVTRADLVNSYELKHQHEQSTKHCRAIGAMQPWSDEQEQIPLFRVSPKYPVAAAKRRKEGYVKLNFTIDEFGQVKAPKVVLSTDPIFEKPSLAALKQWRYAPKFEHGEAVEATDVTVQLDFKMGAN